MLATFMHLGLTASLTTRQSHLLANCVRPGLTANVLVQDHDLDMRGGQIYKAGERPLDRASSPLASRQSSPIATASPAEILNHAGQR